MLLRCKTVPIGSNSLENFVWSVLISYTDHNMDWTGTFSLSQMGRVKFELCYGENRCARSKPLNMLYRYRSERRKGYGKGGASSRRCDVVAKMTSEIVSTSCQPLSTSKQVASPMYKGFWQPVNLFVEKITVNDNYPPTQRYPRCAGGVFQDSAQHLKHGGRVRMRSLGLAKLEVIIMNKFLSYCKWLVDLNIFR